MWRITEDHTFLSDQTDSAVGIGEGRLKVTTNQPERFRLYDDDKTLYYEGEACGLETGFEPLRWARWFAGCTMIKYQDSKTGKWNIL